MLFHRIQHQNIRLSRDTRLFWHTFRLLWKLMKRSPHPTVQTTHWRISMGFRSHHRLLCHFVITGNGTEEYRQVFTPGWFLTQKWCNSSPYGSKSFEGWCYSADVCFVSHSEPRLQSSGRLLSHGFREQSKNWYTTHGIEKINFSAIAWGPLIHKQKTKPYFLCFPTTVSAPQLWLNTGLNSTILHCSG